MNYAQGQDKEYKEIQKFFEGLQQVGGCLKRLQLEDNSYFIDMRNSEFEYITNVIELTDTHNFKKFYNRLDEHTFILGGVKVRRGV